MSKLISFGGIGELNATFAVDEATKTAIGTNYDGAVGKAVTITGDGEVGYGESGDALFGVLQQVESDGYATVQVKGFAENVSMTDTTEDKPAVGAAVCVDGSGSIVKVAEGKEGKGIVISVDDSTILL